MSTYELPETILARSDQLLKDAEVMWRAAEVHKRHGRIKLSNDHISITCGMREKSTRLKQYAHELADISMIELEDDSANG